MRDVRWWCVVLAVALTNASAWASGGHPDAGAPLEAKATKKPATRTEADAGAPPDPHAAAAAKKDEAPPRRSRQRKASEPEAETPPSLTLEALKAEIRRSPGEQEKDALAKEHERMEQLAKSLADARAELRKDTAKLEDLLAKAKASRADADKQAELEAAVVAAGAGGAAAKGKQPLDTLAKALRGMKPTEAAAIVERLTRELAADVFQRMPPADAGKIMGRMRPERAADVANELASRQGKKPERHAEARP